jgi:hypothetical protein
MGARAELSGRLALENDVAGIAVVVCVFGVSTRSTRDPKLVSKICLVRDDFHSGNFVPVFCNHTTNGQLGPNSVEHAVLYVPVYNYIENRVVRVSNSDYGRPVILH